MIIWIIVQKYLISPHSPPHTHTQFLVGVSSFNVGLGHVTRFGQFSWLAELIAEDLIEVETSHGWVCSFGLS